MDTSTEALRGLRAAIEAAGSAKALAERMGMVKSAIGNWRRREGGIPAKHVPRVSRHTGLPAHQLRPDLFPAAPQRPEDAAPAAPAVAVSLVASHVAQDAGDQR